MKAFTFWLLALCCFLPAALVGQEEKKDDKPAKAVKKYSRGRVAPANLFQIHVRSANRNDSVVAKLPKVTAPAYDCRDLGLVPPIVDQGQCGSCWDFSGTGMVTSACIKAGLGTNDGTFALSEQYTLDCGRNGGCNGDDNTTVLDWAKQTGLPLTSVYGPYRGGPGSCKSNGGMKLYKIADWGFCTPNQQMGIASTQDIKNCMVQYGPIGCAVDAGGFDSYSSGVFTGNGGNIDHDVILVGWKDDATIHSGGYWIMRNSWSTDWGMNGYMNIAYGANSIGTEAVWCYVTAPAPPPGPTPPPPPGPTPPPPGPTPPPGPGPSSVTTLTISGTLPAGSYEILPSGTAAAILRVETDLQQIPVPGSKK